VSLGIRSLRMSAGPRRQPEPRGGRCACADAVSAGLRQALAGWRAKSHGSAVRAPEIEENIFYLWSSTHIE
jgi:hypothetical protein